MHTGLIDEESFVVFRLLEAEKFYTDPDTPGQFDRGTYLWNDGAWWWQGWDTDVYQAGRQAVVV